jgi:hypothetical protein
MKPSSPIKICGTRLSNQTDPSDAIGMETLQKRVEHFLPYPLFSVITADGQIVYVGITDAVTNRSAHAYDTFPDRGNDKAMATRDNTGYEVLPIFIAGLPPPLFTIEFNQLSHLVFGRLREKPTSHRQVITRRHSTSSAVAIAFSECLFFL